MRRPAPARIAAAESTTAFGSPVDPELSTTAAVSASAGSSSRRARTARSRSTGSVGRGATAGPPSRAAASAAGGLGPDRAQQPGRAAWDHRASVRRAAWGRLHVVTDAADEGAAAQGYSLAMPVRFRGLTQRQGLLWRGPAGWAEWSPFLDYAGVELVPWLRAADEAADQGWPAPVRTEVPVNSTVPAIGPEQAYAIVAASGCGTAKVKVAERGQTLADDLARCEAVRDALGPGGGSGSTPTAPGTWMRRRTPSARSTASTSSTSSSPAPRSRTWPRSGSGWPGRDARCWSPRTSPSGGPRTPTASSPSTRPTSRCSRWRRSAGCAPPWRSRNGSACRWSCPALSRPRWAWRPGWRWRRPCPSCRTRAAWGRSGCSPTTSSPSRCARSAGCWGSGRSPSTRTGSRATG